MAALSKAAAHERARIAGLKRAVRNGERSAADPALTEAQRNYGAARMADYAKQLVATWPPMSDEQIETVASILRAAGGRILMTLTRSSPGSESRATSTPPPSVAVTKTTACAVKGCCWRGICPLHDAAITEHPRGFHQMWALMFRPVRRHGIKAVIR